MDPSAVQIPLLARLLRALTRLERASGFIRSRALGRPDFLGGATLLRLERAMREVSLKSISLCLGHLHEIQAVQACILYRCLQFVVLVLELSDLLHDVVEVLTEVRGYYLSQLDGVLSLFLFQIERFGAFERVSETVS